MTIRLQKRQSQSLAEGYNGDEHGFSGVGHQPPVCCGSLIVKTDPGPCIFAKDFREGQSFPNRSEDTQACATNDYRVTYQFSLQTDSGTPFPWSR